ncbi:hypothetical protein WJX74_004710 [Apatococcus lobatus]|uniref:Transmembrane protein n=1 Tax=Apatococcus lobatus TaxID=904363 RepID=A0AAW1RLS8_9CHLO
MEFRSPSKPESLLRTIKKQGGRQQDGPDSQTSLKKSSVVSLKSLLAGSIFVMFVCLMVRQNVAAHMRTQNAQDVLLQLRAMDDFAGRDPVLTWQRNKAARKDMQDDGFGNQAAMLRRNTLPLPVADGQGKIIMPPHETYQSEDSPADPNFVYDELAYSFPEHYGELPRAHPAPWGMFDKARQIWAERDPDNVLHPAVLPLLRSKQNMPEPKKFIPLKAAEAYLASRDQGTARRAMLSRPSDEVHASALPTSAKSGILIGIGLAGVVICLLVHHYCRRPKFAVAFEPDIENHQECSPEFARLEPFCQDFVPSFQRQGPLLPSIRR